MVNWLALTVESQASGFTGEFGQVWLNMLAACIGWSLVMWLLGRARQKAGSVE